MRCQLTYLISNVYVSGFGFLMALGEPFLEENEYSGKCYIYIPGRNIICLVKQVQHSADSEINLTVL